MIVPQNNSLESRMGLNILSTKEGIKDNYPNVSLGSGDEGGFAPMIALPEIALGLIKAIDGADYTNQVKII